MSKVQRTSAVFLRSFAFTLASTAAIAGCGKTSSRETAKQVEPAATATPPTQPAAQNPPATAKSDSPAVGDLRKVGRVDFAVSCQGQQEQFDRAMALLHSFFYGEARRLFTELTTKDPACGIAHWGVAMSWYHPLWAPPTPEEMEKGRAAIEKANAGKNSDREKAFITALAVFFAADAPKLSTGPGGMSCHGPTAGDHAGRATAYTAAMEKLYTANPDDSEAASFYALALLGSAKPVDPKLENQNKAAAILEKLWKTRRDHPGVAHYLIHAYDFPPLAEKGLEAAKEYANIAPWVPHALHMPSHIFVRLGMWQENIDGNIASADSAQNYAKEQKLEGMMFEELHALDYLVYGYLQTGRDAKAKEVVDRVRAVKQTYPAIDFVASYAVGAVPARFAVERHEWAEAAALTIPEVAFFAKFPFTEAHLEYARGLGRARSGDVAGAKQSLARLAELREATKDPKFAYFKEHLALQHQAVSAWVAHAEKKGPAAVTALRKAAQMEDKLGKNPVSPGPIDLIYEQLGDMLVLQGKHADAMTAYETALKTSPKRLNSMLGAGQAAEKAGKADIARKYYEQVVAQTKGGDSKRADIAQANAFLAKR